MITKNSFRIKYNLTKKVILLVVCPKCILAFVNRSSIDTVDTMKSKNIASRSELFSSGTCIYVQYKQNERKFLGLKRCIAN